MKSQSKTLWQRLSNKPRWSYWIAWVLCTALGWGTYKHIIQFWYTGFVELGLLGMVLAMLIGIILVGLVQGIILKLYLKKYPIFIWLIVCFFWFYLTSEVGSIIPFLAEMSVYSSMVLYCVVSVWGFRRYACHWERWMFAVFPVLVVLVTAVSRHWMIGGLFIDFMDFFGPSYRNHPLKPYATGLNIGIVTSLVFMTTPKVANIEALTS